MNWVLVFTDRVRSTRGGYIFSLFVCSHLGGGGTRGAPPPLPHPAPHLDLDGGVQRPAPHLDLDGGHPAPAPPPGPGGGRPTPPHPTPPWQAPPPGPGWGAPHPPTWTWMGGCPPTPHRNNIACTCYAAVGMPLAFTQEDFLV